MIIGMKLWHEMQQVCFPLGKVRSFILFILELFHPSDQEGNDDHDDHDDHDDQKS